MGYRDRLTDVLGIYDTRKLLIGRGQYALLEFAGRLATLVPNEFRLIIEGGEYGDLDNKNLDDDDLDFDSKRHRDERIEIDGDDGEGEDEIIDFNKPSVENVKSDIEFLGKILKKLDPGDRQNYLTYVVKQLIAAVEKHIGGKKKIKMLPKFKHSSESVWKELLDTMVLFESYFAPLNEAQNQGARVELLVKDIAAYITHVAGTPEKALQQLKTVIKLIQHKAGGNVTGEMSQKDPKTLYRVLKPAVEKSALVKDGGGTFKIKLGKISDADHALINKIIHKIVGDSGKKLTLKNPKPVDGNPGQFIYQSVPTPQEKVVPVESLDIAKWIARFKSGDGNFDKTVKLDVPHEKGIDEKYVNAICKRINDEIYTTGYHVQPKHGQGRSIMTIDTSDEHRTKELLRRLRMKMMSGDGNEVEWERQIDRIEKITGFKLSDQEVDAIIAAEKKKQEPVNREPEEDLL